MRDEKKLKDALAQEAKKFEEFYLWLEKSMPDIFFKEVQDDWISLIVHALVDFKEQKYFAQIAFNHAAIILCLDAIDSDIRILERFQMYGIKSYMTYISKVPFTDTAHLRIGIIYFTGGQKEESLERLDSSFLRKLSVERQATISHLFERALTRDHCQYEVSEEKGHALHLLLAWKNVPKHNFLNRLARVVVRHNLIMRKVNATYIDPYTVKSVLLLSFDLQGSDGKAPSDITDFLQEITSLKYFGSLDLIDEVFVQKGLMSGNGANLLRTLMNFIHQVLVNANPHLYSLEGIEEGLCRHPELTVKLWEAFVYRFHPEKQDNHQFEEKRKEFLELVMQLDTGYEVLDRRRKNVLLQGMNFVTHTLKTNFFRNNKTSFVFRLDPNYLNVAPFVREEIFPELPFGIFFFKGMHYLGFHVRFKDLARGGLRTVFPERKERVLAERSSVFTECYHLALTQHKKNKDIPEGGAKGVIFLKPDERIEEELEILSKELSMSGFSEDEIQKKTTLFRQEQKLEYLYQTQRAYIKNFLSLINCEPDGTLKAKGIVDYYKKPEYIYLGPDENMHDSMIEWIANTSEKEGYKPGGAFISGKPTSGINHKKYGVTSLGVHVYMQEILSFLKIDPKKEIFTVKMTGGPDGDVAGNEILNLYRDYPKTAKLIALTDVSGTIYDPEGLDLLACVELFHAEKPIRFYPTEKLSKQGFLLDKETKKEISAYVFQTKCFRNGQIEWLSGNEMNALYRNNVHQTKADIFIPCGGRPRALREENVTDFLDEKGVPTAKAIVEGANLYFSPGARTFLEERGVLIVKDSSANKCGVISSSYEVLAGLVLSEKEFVERKEELVVEILKRLEKCARDEARTLITRHQETGEFLTKISDKISNRIIQFTDELYAYFETLNLSNDPNDPLIRCFLDHALPTLRNEYQERLLKEIPDNHKKAIIASFIASHLVYEKGLSWSPKLVDILPLILQDLQK